MVRAAQKIVKDQNAEEGIGRDSELQCCRSSRREADSIQPVDIEIHCDASVFDDHLLKRPGLLLALGQLFFVPPKAFGPLACGRGKEQEQWERETGER